MHRPDAHPRGEARTRRERWHAQRTRWRTDPRTSLLYRGVVVVLGFVVVVMGLVLVPFPGPGWLIVFCGVAIWSEVFPWAERLRDRGFVLLRRWEAWILTLPAFWRFLGGAMTALGIATGLALYVWWSGVPNWLPDVMEHRVEEFFRTHLPARPA